MRSGRLITNKVSLYFRASANVVMSVWKKKKKKRNYKKKKNRKRNCAIYITMWTSDFKAVTYESVIISLYKIWEKSKNSISKTKLHSLKNFFILFILLLVITFGNWKKIVLKNQLHDKFIWSNWLWFIKTKSSLEEKDFLFVAVW